MTPRTTANQVNIKTKTNGAQAAEKACEDRQFEKQFKVEYAAHNDRKVKYRENSSAAAATLWK